MTSEKTLAAVTQEAWISDVSTRPVDYLVQSMRRSGISKSQVPKLCKNIVGRVNVFLTRPLEVNGTIFGWTPHISNNTKAVE
jgi:transposase-like protein